jgi:1-acyl-sn-glycerol-3-phosphate acyltransferase
MNPAALSATVRGAVFYALFYLLMGVIGGTLALPAALSERAARWTAKRFFATVFILLRTICGVQVAVRGQIPQGAVVVAAKHQSMLDVFILFHALPRARFVMKQELLRAPVFGWYARRVGAVPIDRGAGSAAMESMLSGMLREAGSGQMVIYPQGTRVPPGSHRPYKIGVHALYEASRLSCVPVAVNTGKIQPKGVAVWPGTAVVEFLSPIPPGMARAPFMATLEQRIEAASDALA